MEEKSKDYALINEGEENEMEIYGYRADACWITLCVLGYIFSGGVLLLLFYWKPEWSVRANCRPCSLKKANVVLLRSTDDLKKYTRKKVRWMCLTEFKDFLNEDHSIIANKKSIINRAIRQPDLKVKYIRVQKIRYIWDTTFEMFQKIGTLEEEHTCADIHSKFGSGLSKEEQDIRRLVCGHNTIDVEVSPLWKLFFQKVINLFYLYQFFTVVLWLAEGYLGYAIAILLLCVVTISLSLHELRQQAVKLAKLVESHNNVKVSVLGRDGSCNQVESRHLVPGDVVVLTGKNFFLACDAILINGNCILNEGMLTGECIPVTKTQLPQVDNSMPWRKFSDDYKRHVLFCGTEVVRTEPTSHGPVKAIVLRTGFNTTKGDMVRSILYPKPVNFKLYRDVARFFMFLGFLAVIGIVYTIAIFVPRGVSAWRIIVESLVLLTSAICPIIPAALTVGILYAKRRLTQKHIYSISPHRINMCGQLNLFCFDKTGTLTEDGLDLLGIVPSGGSSFQKMFNFTTGNSLPWGPLFGSMVSCHSLIFLDDRLQGDPLDLKMFEATGWVLENASTETKNDGDSSQCMIVKPGPEAQVNSVAGIAIVFQYPFSSALQRMTVITQVMGEEGCTVYMKGAPEMVASFCKPETIPGTFARELELYTFQGFRVIGLAYKAMETGNHDDFDSMPREEVESDMLFLGLLVLENRLKPETNAILTELNTANIRTVMITGDNIQTATTVAKKSGMIAKHSRVILVEATAPDGSTPASVSWEPIVYPEEPDNNGKVYIKAEDVDPATNKEDYHFAMSGPTYTNLEKFFPILLPKLLMNGTVFARMSPGQKSTVIEEYRKLDYYVGMCGDGANDCAALKMAHAGISLSEQEASVAAPFNSNITNIKCVSDLIKEGRAALVTSFCMFKYMSMFGIIEYINTLLLYWHRNIFGNNQFLVHDFAIMFVIFLTMSSTPPWPKLAPYRPPGQLISPPMFFSVVYSILWSIAMQTYAFLVVQLQPWYNETDIYSACYPGNDTYNTIRTMTEREHRTTKNFLSYDNTTLYLLTANHFVIIAFVFSKGKPFRLPVYRNYLFVCVLAIEIALTMFFIFANIPGLYEVLTLVCTPTTWRFHMLGILLVCFFVSWFVEDVLLDNRKLWLALKRAFKLKPGSNYKKLRIDLEADPEWPPLKRIEYADPTARDINCNMESYSNPAFDNNEAIPNGKPKIENSFQH